MKLSIGVALLVLVLGVGMPSSGGAEDTVLPAKVEQEPISRIVMKNGQIYRGWIIEQSDTHIRVDLLGAGEMTLERDKVQSVTVDETVEMNEKGELYKRDPNRTRYLYGPSAVSLKKGEGYFSQKQLFFSSMAYGLTDNISILAGSIIPLLLGSDGTFNFITAVKVGDTISEDQLHLAAGAEAFSFKESGDIWSAGFIFGSATLGSHRQHFTLSAGKPFALSSDSKDLGPIIVTLSGNVRTGRRVSLISENWFFEDYHILSAAARLMGENLAVDVGLLFFKDADIPIPWLDFTYNWF